MFPCPLYSLYAPSFPHWQKLFQPLHSCHLTKLSVFHHIYILYNHNSFLQAYESYFCSPVLSPKHFVNRCKNSSAEKKSFFVLCLMPIHRFHHIQNKSLVPVYCLSYTCTIPYQVSGRFSGILNHLQL